MPIALVVQQELALPVSQAQLRAGLTATLQAVGRIQGMEPEGQRILTVRVTDDAEIRTLNRTFRGIDEATDVLSFGEASSVQEDALVVPDGLPGVLGDLILSRPYIERVAARMGTETADEFMLCFVHGLLHLLGFDHATAAMTECMFTLQDRIVRDLGFRPQRTWKAGQGQADG